MKCKDRSIRNRNVIVIIIENSIKERNCTGFGSFKCERCRMCVILMWGNGVFSALGAVFRVSFSFGMCSGYWG
jgi:hypothetical protein